MKFLKVFLGLAVVSLMSTSCVSLNGQLDVKQMFTAKKKGGFLNLKTIEVLIRPDLYRAELKANSDKNFSLKLSGHDQILIPIKGTSSLNVPDNGRIRVSHNDINQPFDIQGDIDTEVTHGQRIDASEDCSFTVVENHCKKICEAVTCNIVCKDETLTINGSRDMSYHFRTTHRNLSIELMKSDKPEALASFQGSDTQIDRINDFTGVCK